MSELGLVGLNDLQDYGMVVIRKIVEARADFMFHYNSNTSGIV